jgi:outer membrane protein assembly factor BamC
VKLSYAVTSGRLAVLALVAATAGCSSIENMLSGDKADYRANASRNQPLDVPPDLTQLARESRYQPQGGVISAAAAAGGGTAGAATPVAGLPGATPTTPGALRVERLGQQRWLVVPQTPEQIWPQLKAFWEARGFVVVEDNLKAGVIETDWAEDRSKLPNDVVRSTVGRLLGNFFDTGQRDQFRTRVERTETGSEVYVIHRGLEEVYVGERKESTTWRARPNDPQLEADNLARLMVALGAKDDAARTAVAGAAQPATRVTAADGKPATSNATSLLVDEPFDRAWRRVGLALDRGGFTVEDRDRAAGLYYVRYVDPANVGKDEPGWFARMFGDKSNPQAALRYRIQLKASDTKTLLSVQDASGKADTGENAQRIVGLLTNELR